jgi:hypothetical protein
MPNIRSNKRAQERDKCGLVPLLRIVANGIFIIGLRNNFTQLVLNSNDHAEPHLRHWRNLYKAYGQYNPPTYRSFERSFFNLLAPSNRPRSTAAATVNVPPITAQRPVRNPVNVLVRSSRLMTFMGEIS